MQPSCLVYRFRMTDDDHRKLVRTKIEGKGRSAQARGAVNTGTPPPSASKFPASKIAARHTRPSKFPFGSLHHRTSDKAAWPPPYFWPAFSALDAGVAGSRDAAPCQPQESSREIDQWTNRLLTAAPNPRTRANRSRIHTHLPPPSPTV